MFTAPWKLLRLAQLWQRLLGELKMCSELERQRKVAVARVMSTFLKSIACDFRYLLLKNRPKKKRAAFHFVFNMK